MPKLILYVDDSATLRLSLKTTLEMNGFQVETANDGLQAFTRLKHSTVKPDLIITDINMPNMDGLTLIQNVRALPGFRFTPILTLTTESQASKKEEGKRLGATGWMEKPIASADLIKVIKRLLPGA